MTEKFEGGQERALSPATSPDQPPSTPPAADGRADVPEASSATSPAGQAETATATAAAAGHPRAFDAVGAVARAPLEPVEPGPQLGRPGPPVLAGAAIAGLILIAAPFAVSASTQNTSLETVPLTSGSLIAGTSDREAGENAAGTAAAGGDSTAEAPATTGSVNDAPEEDSGGYVPEVQERPAGGAATPDPAAAGTGEEEPNEPAPDGPAGETSTTGGGGDRSGGSGEAPEARISDEDAPGIIGSLPEVGSQRSASEDTPAEDDTGGERSSRSEDAEESGGTERSADTGQQSADGDGPSTLAGAAPAGEREERPEQEQEAPRGEERTAEDGEQNRQPANEENADAPPPAPAPSEEPAPPAEEQPAAQPSPAAWSFSEVVGPGCPSDAAASYGRTGHWQEGDGRKSWATRQGADQQEDCNADYDAIPVSGNPEEGNGEFAYWTFSPGRAGAKCELFVHIPQDESPLWIAEQEARYQVFSGDRPEGDAIGVFGIEQAGVRGGWVQVTGFTAPAETFTIQLTNIGADPLAGQGTDRAHVAASVIRTTCS
ncbi:hypothetical protein [Marinactinospora rubrisoli]|uniref:Uncharacterized protein n=1 Tax=Marinactinospora rubrisoli TaxID=2715399 RepID=A0ABW2KA15_9ACTN